MDEDLLAIKTIHTEKFNRFGELKQLFIGDCVCLFVVASYSLHLPLSKLPRVPRGSKQVEALTLNHSHQSDISSLRHQNT